MHAQTHAVIEPKESSIGGLPCTTLDGVHPPDLDSHAHLTETSCASNTEDGLPTAAALLFHPTSQQFVGSHGMEVS